MTDSEASPAGAVVPPPGCPLHSNAVPLYGDVLQGDTAELWERLRKQFGGIAPIEFEPGTAAWLMLGYNEHLEVLKNPHLFSHDGRNWRELREGRITPESGTYPVFGYRPNALHSDGVEHQRLRGALVDSFEKLQQSRLRLDIKELANELIDSFAPDGQANIIEQYSVWIPLLVLNRMFGQDDEAGYFLCDSMMELWNGEGEAAVDADRKMVQYLMDLISRKRAEPGEDITSWLLEHPAELTDEEVAQQIMLVIAAAHDPTANLIGNTLRVLLTERSMRVALAGSQMRVDETIDQVLWMDPPFQTLPGRYARQETQVAGWRIQEGDCLILGFAPAHKDPLVSGDDGSHPYSGFAANRAHLAWSAGPHRCPAQGIARRLASVSIETLVERLSDMRLSVPESELRWRPSLFIRGLVSLPVEFTPEKVPEPVSGEPWPTTPVNQSSSTPTPETSKDKPAYSESSGLWSRLSSLVRSMLGR